MWHIIGNILIFLMMALSSVIGYAYECELLKIYPQNWQRPLSVSNFHPFEYPGSWDEAVWKFEVQIDSKERQTLYLLAALTNWGWSADQLPVDGFLPATLSPSLHPVELSTHEGFFVVSLLGTTSSLGLQAFPFVIDNRHESLLSIAPVGATPMKFKFMDAVTGKECSYFKILENIAQQGALYQISNNPDLKSMTLDTHSLQLLLSQESVRGVVARSEASS